MALVAQFGPAEPLPNGRYTPCLQPNRTYTAGPRPITLQMGRQCLNSNVTELATATNCSVHRRGLRLSPPPAAVRQLPRVCDQCHLH